MSYHINEMLMEVLPLERSRLYIDILADFEMMNYFQHRLQLEDLLMSSDGAPGNYVAGVIDDIVMTHIDLIIERHGIRLHRNAEISVPQKYIILKGLLTLGSLEDPTMIQDALNYGGDSLSKFVAALGFVCEVMDFELYEWIEWVSPSLIDSLSNMASSTDDYVVPHPAKNQLMSFEGTKYSNIVMPWLSTGVPLGFPLRAGFEQIRGQLTGLSIEDTANELMVLTLASSVSESFVEEATGLSEALFDDITFTAKVGRYFLDNLPEHILNA